MRLNTASETAPLVDLVNDVSVTPRDAASLTSRPHRRPRSDHGRFTIAALVGLAAAAIPYVWVLWGGSPNPLRTAFPGNAFSNFYDIQARALFHGHWNVPSGVLGIEGFVVHGRTYTYFEPLPSLLRMPVLLFTSSLDGRLTALSMLAAWIVTGAFVSLLLWRVRIVVRGDAPLGRTEAVSYGFVIAAMMGGSVLVYLASAPYVYNEDFAWGVATSVGALFALLGMLERPSLRRVLLLGALVLAANMSRLTLAWGCDIGTLLAAAWFLSGRAGQAHRRWAWPTAVAGLVPLAMSCYVTWAKFGYPFGLPMADQVWTQIDLHRQQFLAANGGKAFSPTFIPTTLTAYLRPDGLRFSDVFPFITMPAQPPAVVGGVVMDMLYRTSSAPDSMPLLVILSGWGVVATFRRKPAGRTALVRIPLLGAAAATAGVFLWGYVANRYLADFLPLLFVASAVGVAALWNSLEGRSTRTRMTGASIIAVVAVFSIVGNAAIASSPADVGAWQGSKIASYVQTQEDFSNVMGDPIAANVRRGSVLPSTAAADTLFVVGHCSALYISNGENYNPWIPVYLASPFRTEFSVRFSRAASKLQSIQLVSMGRNVVSTVSLEYRGSRMRVVFADPLFSTVGAWIPVRTGRTYGIDVAADVPRQNLLVSVDGFPVVASMISSGEPQISNLSPALAKLVEYGHPWTFSIRRIAPSPQCTQLLP